MPLPQDLFDKYINNQCSPHEVEALMLYFHTDKQDQLNKLILRDLEMPGTDTGDEQYEQVLNMAYQHIQAGMRQSKPATRPLWPRVAAIAASVLLFLSAGAYFWVQRQHQQQTAQIQRYDIAPGVNQATLTLANGQQIALSKNLRGKLAQQGNTSVNVSADKALTYVSGTAQSGGQVDYNTLSTVRGQQSPFPLQLADGTRVWLNAESSITYPVAFTGKERKVTVTGEAYFEVVHNGLKPFRVLVKDQTIEDIGTHFNINAYADEPLSKTTLMEGSISIAYKNDKVVLVPGQQAEAGAGNALQVKSVDTEGVMAWKNGYFLFDNENLENIMRRVSRWYNVQVEYEDQAARKEVFSGTVSRYKNVSDLIKTLELTKAVHFKIEQKKITVTY